MSEAPATGLPERLPVRSCGNCTLCCKVYPVPAIDNKPANVWCKHCSPGRGCGIWEARPQFCQDFHCHWINEKSFGEEWKPSIAKFVMNNEGENRFAIICDPGHPTAWSRDPYGSELRKIAAKLLTQGRYMMVYAGPMKHIVLPDQDVSVGKINDNRLFSIRKRRLNGVDLYSVEFGDAP